MSSFDLKAYVTIADGNLVRIRVVNDIIVHDLEKLGFVLDSEVSELIIQTRNNNDKGLLFSKLRDMGVCFSAGKEWSPSEVFEYLREAGLVTGNYQRVSWVKPGEFRITSA